MLTRRLRLFLLLWARWPGVNLNPGYDHQILVFQNGLSSKSADDAAWDIRLVKYTYP